MSQVIQNTIFNDPGHISYPNKRYIENKGGVPGKCPPKKKLKEFSITTRLIVPSIADKNNPKEKKPKSEKKGDKALLHKT